MSTKCQCRKGCTAKVVSAGKKYAKGHNPASRSLPVTQLRQEMSAEEYAKYRAAQKELLGNYGVEKRPGPCRWGCGFTGGVRELQRHRKDCAKRPYRSTKARLAHYAAIGKNRNQKPRKTA